LVQEINASSAEQADGITQVTKAIQQLDQVVQQNATATEEMSSTSEELAGQAEQLRQAAAFFKIEMGHKQGTSHPRSSHGPKPARTVRAMFTGDAVSREKKAAKLVNGVDRGSKEASSKGVTLDMGDADDTEFERY
jgi:methyl-accepting chemotaxis protein